MPYVSYCLSPDYDMEYGKNGRGDYCDYGDIDYLCSVPFYRSSINSLLTSVETSFNNYNKTNQL